LNSGTTVAGARPDWDGASACARPGRQGSVQHLSNCDAPRRNDLDGRGALSEAALAEFTTFFLNTCLDQVRFMEQLVQPDRFRDRILLWRKKKFAQEHFRQSQVRSSKPFSSAASCRAVTSLRSWERANARHGALFPHCSVVACSPPQAPARRC
jgi:hypothetical protein